MLKPTVCLGMMKQIGGCLLAVLKSFIDLLKGNLFEAFIERKCQVFTDCSFSNTRMLFFPVDITLNRISLVFWDVSQTKEEI